MINLGGVHSLIFARTAPTNHPGHASAVNILLLLFSHSWLDNSLQLDDSLHAFLHIIHLVNSAFSHLTAGRHVLLGHSVPARVPIQGRSEIAHSDGRQLMPTRLFCSLCAGAALHVSNKNLPSQHQQHWQHLSVRQQNLCHCGCMMLIDFLPFHHPLSSPVTF